MNAADPSKYTGCSRSITRLITTRTPRCKQRPPVPAVVMPEAAAILPPATSGSTVLSAKSAARKPAAAKHQPKPAEKTVKPGNGMRSAVIIGVVGLVVVVAVVGFLFWQREEPKAAFAAGTEPGVIAQVESLYNDIYVYRRPNGFYVLSFGAERLVVPDALPTRRSDADVERARSGSRCIRSTPATR